MHELQSAHAFTIKFSTSTSSTLPEGKPYQILEHSESTFTKKNNGKAGGSQPRPIGPHNETQYPSKAWLANYVTKTKEIVGVGAHECGNIGAEQDNHRGVMICVAREHVEV